MHSKATTGINAFFQGIYLSYTAERAPLQALEQQTPVWQHDLQMTGNDAGYHTYCSAALPYTMLCVNRPT